MQLRERAAFPTIGKIEPAMVPGLSQDRVSKIFSGQVGHMTIDKLVEILSSLKFKVAVKAKAA